MLSAKKLWKSVVGYTVTALAVVGGFPGIYTFQQGYSRYDLRGKWIITNNIQATSYRPYQGLKLGYIIFLTQHGTDIVGTGEKESENGRDLPPGAHSHINITGSSSGRKVAATFVEEGSERKTEGTFDWTYESRTNTLSGTFTSTAADAAGLPRRTEPALATNFLRPSRWLIAGCVGQCGNGTNSRQLPTHIC